jgi:hypothetical protein
MARAFAGNAPWLRRQGPRLRGARRDLREPMAVPVRMVAGALGHVPVVLPGSASRRCAKFGRCRRSRRHRAKECAENEQIRGPRPPHGAECAKSAHSSPWRP